MSSQSITTCDCGAPIAQGALLCARCGKYFDGSAGNTILPSRQLTKRGQSIRFGEGLSSQSFLAPVTEPPMSQGVEKAKTEVKIAAISFSRDARLLFGVVSPQNAQRFVLTPDSLTNEAAGLRLAGEVWKRDMPHARLNILFFGDGVPTTGGGLFGSDFEAAEKVAQELKQQGVRVATIGFAGETMDFAHLRKMASSPALAFEAHAGSVTPAFLCATQSFTINRWGQKGAELVAFVIDSSGSMGEGNKKQEVEAAVNASIEFLRKL